MAGVPPVVVVVVAVAVAANTLAFAPVELAIVDYNDLYEHEAHLAYAVLRPHEMMFREFAHAVGSAIQQSPSVPDRF